MGLFDLFRKAEPVAPPPEHAVIVEFSYGSTDLKPIFELGDRLREAIESAGAGEYDGNEVEAVGASGSLYMYGPSADALFNVVGPILRTCPFMRGATVRLRYGPPGKESRQVEHQLP